MTAKLRRRFRFSLRTLFVLVTVAAISLGLWRRAEKRANFHTLKAIAALGSRSGQSRLLPPPDQIAAYQKREAHFDALAKYHLAMRDKWRRIFWQPWIELQADPAKPPEL